MKNLEFRLNEASFQELEFQPLGITTGDIGGKTYVIIADYFGPEGIADGIGHVHGTSGRFVAYEVLVENGKLSLKYAKTFPVGDPLWTDFASIDPNNRAKDTTILPDGNILFTRNLESDLNVMDFDGNVLARIPYERSFGKFGNVPQEKVESFEFLDGILYSVNNYGTKIAAYSINWDKEELNLVRSVHLDEIDGMKDFLTDEVKTPIYDPNKAYEEQRQDLVQFLMYGLGTRNGHLWLIREHRTTKVKEGLYVIDPENFKLREVHAYTLRDSFPGRVITGNGMAFLDSGLLVTQFTFDREKDFGKPKLVFIPNENLS